MATALSHYLNIVRDNLRLNDSSEQEAIHELGHTFNLRHCKEHTCLMHYCRDEHDVDQKSDQLCRYCKVLLNDEIKRLKS